MLVHIHSGMTDGVCHINWLYLSFPPAKLATMDDLAAPVQIALVFLRHFLVNTDDSNHDCRLDGAKRRHDRDTGEDSRSVHSRVVVIVTESVDKLAPCRNSFRTIRFLDRRSLSDSPVPPEWFTPTDAQRAKSEQTAQTILDARMILVLLLS